MELLLYPDDLCSCFKHADVHEIESKKTLKIFVFVYWQLMSIQFGIKKQNYYIWQENKVKSVRQMNNIKIKKKFSAP